MVQSGVVGGHVQPGQLNSWSRGRSRDVHRRDHAIATVIRVFVATVLPRETSLSHSLLSLFLGEISGFCGYLGFGLLIPHGRIATVPLEQLRMCASFYNPAPVKYDDLLGVGDGGQAVSTTVSLMPRQK